MTNDIIRNEEPHSDFMHCGCGYCKFERNLYDRLRRIIYPEKFIIASRYVISTRHNKDKNPFRGRKKEYVTVTPNNINLYCKLSKIIRDKPCKPNIVLANQRKEVIIP